MQTTTPEKLEVANRNGSFCGLKTSRYLSGDVLSDARIRQPRFIY